MSHWSNLQIDDLPNEVWLPIAGWENSYLISNYARVKSLSRNVAATSKNKKKYQYTTKEKILAQSNSCGYLKVLFYRDAKGYKYFVHILSATYFVPNPDNKPNVNHWDGDRRNNLPYNLVWSTILENSRHAIDVLHRKVGAKDKFGALHPQSKKVNQFSLSGSLVKKWDSIADAKRFFKGKHCHIPECCKGVRETEYGYKWGYA